MSYTAVVLDAADQQKLIDNFRDLIPPQWKIYCHHMTINMGGFDKGPLPASGFNLNDKVELEVISLAYDDLVMAVGIGNSSNVPSTNAIKHITVAVNEKNGGKPFFSNKLINWTPTTPFTLNGTIMEQ